MSKVPVSKARESLAEIINRVTYTKERVVIARRGKEVVAVIPVEDLKLLEKFIEQEEERQDLADAQAALDEAKLSGFIPWDKVKSEAGF